MPHDERVTQTLTGNGLVIECTEKSGGLVPWWWIGDASQMPKALSQTYRYRDLLKAYGCRWSKRRAQWYYIGRELPEEIAALLGPQDTASEPVVLDNPPTPAPRYSPPPTVNAATFREAYQQRVLRRFAEQFQSDLDRVTRHPALPAVATIRLDDPWA